MAGMAMALPKTSLPAQNPAIRHNPGSKGPATRLLCASDRTVNPEKFIESIKSIKEINLHIDSVAVDYQKPAEFLSAIQGRDADILILYLPRFTFSFGKLYDSMGDLGIPLLILAQNPDLILIDANFAASLRTNGARVLFATSPTQALQMIKALAAPRILEGKKAVIYGRRFDSTSVPAHNLSEDYIYAQTGVRLQYRPMEELMTRLKSVSEIGAEKEAERWKKEAQQIVEPTESAIFEASKLYVLLRSIMESEGFSAISIDCLALLFNPNPPLPFPCLAFARLRDEGFTAACEADVCGLLSSMFLQEISKKPSFFANVLSVNLDDSTILLSHCVAPLKMMGSEAAPLSYRLRDYHGMGKGVVPEVKFPAGIEVITGAFSKDLQKFIMWPGRIRLGAKDESVAPAFPVGFRRVTCSNNAVVTIKDADHFLQNIAGIHHIMITGNYYRRISEALLGMNIGIVGPSDFTAPETI